MSDRLNEIKQLLAQSRVNLQELCDEHGYKVSKGPPGGDLRGEGVWVEWFGEMEWLIDEVERLRELEQRTRIFPMRKLDEMARPNLKLLLMELGNRLVTEHGWEPPAGKWWDRVPSGEHTGLIVALTEQINAKPAMQESLTALGVEWPMPVGEVI